MSGEPSWNPFATSPPPSFTTTYGYQPNYIPPPIISSPKPLEDNVPFGIGQELIVDIDVNPRGFNNVYINDMIPLTVDIPGTDNLERCKAAALLAIHATA